MTGDAMREPEALADLLDQAHAAVSRAEFGRLADLTEAIEGALDRLETCRDRTLLLQVHKRATRNAACLLAAQRGLRAARRRVEEIKRARLGLVTYGPTGSRTEPHPDGVLRKRC